MIKKKDNDIKNALCTSRWGYPLVDFSKGEVRTCCRTRGERISDEQIEELGINIFLNTDYQKKRRLEMFKGIRHPDCNSCWIIEDSGMQSPRLPNQRLPTGWVKANDHQENFTNLENNTVLLEKNTNTRLRLEDINSSSPILESHQPYMLEINLSNLCDLQCTYCCPYFSSRWENDMPLWAIGVGYKEFGEKEESYIKHDIRKEVNPQFMPLFWEWFNKRSIHTLTRIGIIGGEPLINPLLPEFLKTLISSYKNLPFEKRPNSGYQDKHDNFLEDHRPLIWFVTNLNTPDKIMDRFINEYLPQLSNYFYVEIHASLESVGKRIEYTRHGLKWERFKKNAEKLCQLKLPGFDFGFQIALNSLSISGLPELLKFGKYLHDKFDRGIILKQNLVSFPEFHHPAILTPDFAYYLEEALLFLEEHKDKVHHVNDYWGRWNAYYDYIKTIYTSIKEGKGNQAIWTQGSLEDVRSQFYHFFSQYDKKYNMDFLKTFPEYKNFYKTCQLLFESRNIT